MKRGQLREMISPYSKRLHNVENIDLPLDLMVEILKKLPAKSLMRFRCVSKQWSSIISESKDFINAIIARSLTQPPRDAHFVFKRGGYGHKECFLSFSSTKCHPNRDKVIVLSIEGRLVQYVRGLICCWFYKKVTIYNPTTRQSFYLPETPSIATCIFGYDPIEDQYKALLFLQTSSMEEERCQVFTLGDPKAKQWRTIQGIGPYPPEENAVCINGVNYFMTSKRLSFKRSTSTLMSFDVRFEKFYHVEAPLIDRNTTLINYQGKLGMVCFEREGMELWVMEDAKKGKQGWHKIFFHEIDGYETWHVVGGTLSGEIILVQRYTFFENELLHAVLYYDAERRSTRYVDLKDTYLKEKTPFMTTSSCTFPNHVENTMYLY